MKGPGGGVGTDAAILHAGDFGCRPWMQHALRITREEGQVQRLIDHSRPLIRPSIGNERIWVMNEVVRPGASAYWGECSGTAVCADYTEASEQAEAAQNTSRDDQ